MQLGSHVVVVGSLCSAIAANDCNDVYSTNVANALHIP